MLVAKRARTRKPLTRERVLDAAAAIADADGIEALSMRKLGQALGVEAMSLYNHVANKGELVVAMVDRVVGEFDLPEDERRWEAAIRRCAISAHDLLLEHPWACELALIPSDMRVVGGPRIRYMEWLLRRLREAGFSREITYSAYHTLDSHIFGFTLWQLGHAKAARRTMAGDTDVSEWAKGFVAQMRPRHPYLAEHAE
jgi:AcrR family transcriptional regulator